MPRIDPVRISATELLDVPDDCRATAALFAGGDQWYSFGTSYRLAADALAAAIEQRPGTANVLTLPLIYLYRHYIELRLKSLLLDAGELLDDPQQVPPAHYLVTLWHRVRSLLLKVDRSSEGPWLERADAVIHQFDALDDGSFSFRYPVDKDNNASFDTPLRICPAVVKRVVDELSIVLEGASAQVDDYAGLKHEHM